jgi:tetratricopeptide (TPR) repeat protein
MLRPTAEKRTLRCVTISMLLVLSIVTSAWAGASQEDLCDVEADFALGIEDYPAAIKLHRQLIDAHRGDALAHYHLGFAYSMTGNVAGEISEYLTAVKLRLHKWDLFLNLGLAYLSQNETQKATEALETAVALGPDHAEAHFNLAIAYEKENRLPEALEQITTSLHHEPNDLDAHNAKAIICVEMDDRACARDEWTHVVQVAPDYVPARLNLAILTGSHLPAPVSTSTTSDGLAFSR